MVQKRVALKNHINYLPGIHPSLMPTVKTLTVAHKSQIRDLLRRTRNGRKAQIVKTEENVGRVRPTMKLSGKALLARGRFERAMKEINALMREYAKLTGKGERALFYSNKQATEIYGELNKLNVNNTFHITIGPTHIDAAKRILAVAKQRVAEERARATN